MPPELTATAFENARPETVSTATEVRNLTSEEQRDELMLILDAAKFFLSGRRDIPEIINHLVLQLSHLRAACSPGDWARLVPLAKAHPVREVLHQDPFTRRSFEKPRGYAGDGVLLDLLYRHEDVQDQVRAATEVGQQIYAATSVSSSSRAVQERRDLLSALVDRTADRVENASVLAVAGGHLREAEGCLALREGRLACWQVLDQDEANLNRVATRFRGSAVQPLLGSIKALIKGELTLQSFDLIYSAGVYDYLDFQSAVALTRRLLSLLTPGGELHFGNFSTEVVPAGYMETFMDWQLLTRGEDDMMQILRAAAEGQPVKLDVYFGANRHIVYGSLRRMS